MQNSVINIIKQLSSASQASPELFHAITYECSDGTLSVQSNSVTPRDTPTAQVLVKVGPGLPEFDSGEIANELVSLLGESYDDSELADVITALKAQHKEEWADALADARAEIDSNEEFSAEQKAKALEAFHDHEGDRMISRFEEEVLSQRMDWWHETMWEAMKHEEAEAS